MTRNVTTVEPLFIKECDMPSPNIAHIAIVRAISRSISPQGIEGVQRIGPLWRIYLKSTAFRVQLMTRKSIVLSGKMVALYDQNPLRTHQSSPEDRKDKLTIRGLPISVSNEEVGLTLASKDIVLCSDVKFSCMRDENGSLTSYKNGDRFVYCNPFDEPLPRNQTICNFSCLVLHHGKDSLHCKSCNTAGHKVGDPMCKAKAAKDSILAFSGYQHPLSNQYPTPISAFNLDNPFRSVEHAFYWKMAMEFQQLQLADRIMDAAHAGIVKHLSKEMDEKDRYTWENENIDIMKELLMEKSRSCNEFRECLLMNKEKVLADCTFNKMWGTGLNKWITEATKPDYWPGNNTLGALLMDVTESIIMSPSPMDSENVVNEDQDGTSEDELTDEGGLDDEGEHVVEEDMNEEGEKNENGEKNEEGEKLEKSETLEETLEATQIHSQRNQRQKRKAKKKGKNSQNSQNTQHMENDRKDNQGLNDKSNAITKSEKSKTVDIRMYLDPQTGKRKTTETTPEKQENSKKVIT